MVSIRRFELFLLLAFPLGVAGLAIEHPVRAQGGGKENSAGPRCGEGGHEDELSVVEAAG